MPATKRRVEIAPMTAQDWADTLWVWAGVAALCGVLVIVSAGVRAEPGVLFILAGLLFVAGVVVKVQGGKQ